MNEDGETIKVLEEGSFIVDEKEGNLAVVAFTRNLTPIENLQTDKVTLHDDEGVELGQMEYFGFPRNYEQYFIVGKK